MKPRHKIDEEYNNDPRHIKQWTMTIEWLKQFDIKGICLDCGEPSDMTSMIVQNFEVGVMNTHHDLNYNYKQTKGMEFGYYDIFAFEVIEHLINPLVFIEWVKSVLIKDGTFYLSTPIFRPSWMRNKERHFHEFNYNELEHLIDVAGFKIVDEKIINPTPFSIGFRPILRKLGIGGRNILMRLKRK